MSEASAGGAPLTVLDEGRSCEVLACIEAVPRRTASTPGERRTRDRSGSAPEPGEAGGAPRAVRLSPEALRESLGFELRPEGLCRGGLCIPTTARPALVAEGGVDLVALAELLERPLAIDWDERVAVLGASASRRAEQLASLEAPDFTLDALDGRPRSLADLRGTKVFLLAFASW